EPDRARAALRRERRSLLARQVAAVAVVSGRSSLCDRGVVAGLHLVFGAEALVGVAGGQELIGRREVLLGAGALQDRSLVPLEAETAQRVLDTDHPLLSRAGAVGVFDAQGEGSAVVSSEEPVEESGADAADVQRTRGGRRKPAARMVRHERGR